LENEKISANFEDIKILRNLQMLKFSRYFFLIISGIILVAGFKPSLFKTWDSWGLLPDDFKYGDLFRLTYLPQFKATRKTCDNPKPSKVQNLHLYLIGDSFLEEERTDSSDFVADKYTYLHWQKNKQIFLDTNATNVLILESVERHAREHFAEVVKNFSKDIPIENPQNPQKQAHGLLETMKSWEEYSKKEYDFEHSDERYEHVLFKSDLTMPFKELKAWLNWNLFGRVNGTATVSSDEKNIFYELDTNTKFEKNSSFAKLDDAEVNRLVEQINQSAVKYQQMGFDVVLLSIIPNKASVLEPNLDKYNHLIERIQGNKNLKVSHLDIYSKFKGGKGFYELSDSHWSCEGRTEWLNMTNSLLKDLNK
jgi:hypothetical protein